MLIEWNASLEAGIAHLDRDYKYVVALANRLYDVT